MHISEQSEAEFNTGNQNFFDSVPKEILIPHMARGSGPNFLLAWDFHRFLRRSTSAGVPLEFTQSDMW
jgi:hypothetical protein